LNFGIGLPAPTNADNIIEDNVIVGNANGIYVVMGAQGNIFRRNLVTGNPPVQVSVDNPSSSGFDIRNLATAGTNTFQGNTCLTSLNAPCSSATPSLTASPNPIPVTGNAAVGSTTIGWIAGDVDAVEVHIGSPNGRLFAGGGNRGSSQTGPWVSDGMTFYLQDVSEGKALTAANTLATLVVNLKK
jgi:parallel beta-helix repeat protein